MVKALPYLPSKASMSIKRRITLRPKFQSQLTQVLRRKNNSNFPLTGVGIPIGTSPCSLAPIKYRCDDQSMEDVASTCGTLETSNGENETNSSHQETKHLCIDDMNHFIDDKPLPYLPSCETSRNGTLLSSKSYRLEPRSTSKQILNFFR